MAYSDSTDYSQNAKQIIVDALILCGGLEDDEQPTAAQEKIALRALNRMVKAWGVKGLKAWCWMETTLSLTTGAAAYAIGPGGALDIPRPLEIKNPRKVVDSQETPLRLVSRSDYMNQVGKLGLGEPVFVYYDPQLDSGQLYVWPSPSDEYHIRFSARQHIDDFDLTTNDPFFPPEWLDAIVYGLAMRLLLHYGVTGEDAARITMLAQQFLQDAEDADREDGSVFIQPEVCY